MRYENWDVILFPRNSHIPIQEFKTACYVTQDEYGRQQPCLTSYIASLPVATPFRVSIHSWVSKAKPTAIIESQRKANQRIVYTVQIIVDGTRIFHDFYDISSKWPQEIESEKRTIGHPDRPTSQRKLCLEFPPFRQNVLLCSSWDARDHNGRIKIFLSEQLIGKTSTSEPLEFGASNDIVCFAFQHAPRDVLEQAGISWPIRNPLYLPSMVDTHSPKMQTSNPRNKPRHPTDESHPPSPPPPPPKQPVRSGSRSSIQEVGKRLNTAPLPPYSELSKPPIEVNPDRFGIWDDTMNIPAYDPFDDVSMVDSWSTHRATTHSTADTSMPDLLIVSPSASKPRKALDAAAEGRDREGVRRVDETRKKGKRGDRQVIVTLRQDQFGTLLEALSPPKKGCDPDFHSHRHERDRKPSFQPNPHAFTPAIGPVSKPLTTKPSAAAVARTASYPDLQNLHPYFRNISNQASPSRADGVKGGNEPKKPSSTHRPSFVGGKENRVPTPHPFAQGLVPGYSSSKYFIDGSDIEMRDPSSLFSSASRFDRGPQFSAAGKSSPIPLPTSGGSVKSRKEGLGVGSPLGAENEVRHDKSLLPAFETPIQNQNKAPQNTPMTTSPEVTRIESIINPDEGKQFVPGHRSGMESLDRISQQLFSALGDGTSSFDTQIGSTTIDSGLLPGLEDFESPVMKRKRQGTIGGERGKSPEKKIPREDNLDMVDENRGVDNTV
ncbi:hypothetical protein CC78DRAFT_613494 [Lojkania enalia]|uniref:Uncharacterized protein n=1 Tax=Lojkania enalia TaxID=147567 RepID=A0A9P4N957_9PLEO|nr:hypothetical protein CC78DRAFT_613494 [Didymosphaeria enalia]